ncbi:MAG: BolA family protein [Thiomonas sp.]|jgi:BolA protein
MSPDSRAEKIRACLQHALQPETLTVVDVTASHVGHGGYDPLGSHFRVHIVSARFAGLPRLARHRLVYDALASMLRRDIHALTLDCQAPGERLSSASEPDR